MFLYRDEVYDPESQDRGTAEVIVAKHRNGPVGQGPPRLARPLHQVRQHGQGRLAAAAGSRTGVASGLGCSGSAFGRARRQILRTTEPNCSASEPVL